MTTTPAKERILEAARDLFFKHGFEKVSTDVLAREAAVSKATIYRIFDNMAHILREVTKAETVHFRDVFKPEIDTTEELDNRLTRYGIKLLHFMNRPETMEFARLMHEEARENPEIGRTFFEASYKSTQDDLSYLFSEAQQRGVLTSGVVASTIAEDFMGLVMGLGIARVQMGLSKVPYTDIDERVQRAVATIIKMHS